MRGGREEKWALTISAVIGAGYWRGAVDKKSGGCPCDWGPRLLWTGVIRGEFCGAFHPFRPLS